jgi:tetratricopeptide (TPR) repeat protein
MHRKALPDGHPLVANDLTNLGSTLLRQGKAAEAEALYREAAGMFQKSFGADDWQTATARCGIGGCLTAQKRYAEAETELLAAERALSAAGTVAARYQVRCLRELVVLYDNWDDAEPGKGHFDKALQWNEKLPPGARGTTRPITTQSTVK